MECKIINYRERDFEDSIAIIGDKRLLQYPKVAFFCASKCPGDIILQSYDLAQYFRCYNIAVISGFHSPVEEQCFRILSNGMQPLILCPARNISKMRLSPSCRRSIRLKRLVIISPFINGVKRASRESAFKRNRFIASIAQAVFVAYASPSSHIFRFCEEMLRFSNPFPVLTFLSKWNQPLIDLGINALPLKAAVNWFDQHGFVKPEDKSTLPGFLNHSI